MAHELSNEELLNVTGGTAEATSFVSSSALKLNDKVKVYTPNTLRQYVYLCNGTVNSTAPFRVVGTNGLSYTDSNAKFALA